MLCISDSSSTSIPFRSSNTDMHSAKDRKSTRLNSSHSQISYAVFCLKKKKNKSTANFSRFSIRYLLVFFFCGMLTINSDMTASSLNGSHVSHNSRHQDLQHTVDVTP